MKRLFIAIKIEPEQQLLKVYNDIKFHCRWSKIKWVDDTHFHITLKFFGETPEINIPLIEQVMEKITNENTVFDFNLKGVGIFGSHYRPRVIWLGLQHDEKLKILGEQLIKNLEKEGFLSDRQNFIPHLTVGRIKYIQDKKRLQNIVDKYRDTFLQKVNVTKIILYESKLRKEGPQYIPLKVVYLNR